MVSLLPATAADVMWTGSGVVTAGNPAFGVATGNPVTVVVRYAPENRVNMKNYPVSAFVTRRIYHGSIKLRIEVRVGTRRWISYTESAPLLQNSNSIDVVSCDPGLPPGSSAADLIQFNATTVNGAAFEHFDVGFTTAFLGIALTISDGAYPLDLLTLGQFPGPSLNTAKISGFTGPVFAGSPTQVGFNFSLNLATVTLGNYYPPLSMTLHRAPLGGFQLKFNSEAEVFYELQASENLKDWYFAGYVFGTGQTGQTIPAPPGPFGHRFYRLRRLAEPPF